mmetsp:Transcript_26102/g.32611  ORF Transcript_26102/g.32611 Transcript_26102/m.32611 type:complete len:262 (+) Transcript_26102:11-796(+)
MSDTLVLLGASLTWFTPLAATRVYENAFGLAYTSINLAGLSLTLFFLMLLSFIYMALPYPRTIGTVTGVGGVVGLGAQLLCTLYLRSLDPITKIIFWVSTALVGLYFADVLLKAMVAAIARTTEKLGVGATEDANRVGTISLLGLPAGMLIALAYTESFYDVRDTYFVNEESAMKACMHKSLILVSLNLAATISSFILSFAPWASSADSPLTVRTSFGDFLGELFSLRTLTVSIELALVFSAIFFMMMQPEYLTNSFRFTS